jgi:hypothetical protein
LDHARGDVDADDVSRGRHPFGGLDRGGAVAAAHVEDPLSGAQARRVEHRVTEWREQGDLLEACGIDPRVCIIVINGAVMARGSELHDGDHVQLHPAQAGG